MPKNLRMDKNRPRRGEHTNRRPEAADRSFAARRVKRRRKRDSGHAKRLIAAVAAAVLSRLGEVRVSRAFRRICKFAVVFLSVAAFAVFAVFIWGALTDANAVEVYLNGDIIGVVREKTLTSEFILENAQAALKQRLGGTNAKTEDVVTVRPVRAARSETTLYDVVFKEICDKLDYSFEACAITANGVSLAVLRGKDEAEGVLGNIKKDYDQPGIEISESSFVEEVALFSVFVKDKDIITADDAYKLLTKAVDTSQDYFVAAGDTLDGIALRFGMTRDALDELNPGIAEIERKLPIGHRVTVSVPKPVLSVRTVERVTYTVVAPKKSLTRENEDMPRSHRKVIRQGKDGQKEVTENVVRLNGFEEPERDFVSEKILFEPVDEIIDFGIQ